MAGKYSKRRIRRAGDELASGSLSGEDRSEALEIVGYWRAAHMEPLHKTLLTLEEICEQNESTVLVSRLKRIDTILNKLNRPGYNFTLTTLRDIAGCRLILSSDEDVRRIAEKIQRSGQCYAAKDYMDSPKLSGYRGIHLICRYSAESYGYDDLNVEVQVRSRLQHDWATAVEVYDMATGANLKFGGGSEAERRYFWLASELMNAAVEDAGSFRSELRILDAKLHVLETLNAAADSMYAVGTSGLNITRSDSCLISVDLGVQQISLEVFSAEAGDEAAAKYTSLESEEQVGLVYLLARAGSLEDLRRAYPNYYSDISGFVGWLRNCVE